MLSSDGYDFQPYVVESFIINPGERYDFLLRANQDPGNYWVRAVSMEVCLLYWIFSIKIQSYETEEL